jgi:hypothetical protein
MIQGIIPKYKATIIALKTCSVNGETNGIQG